MKEKNILEENAALKKLISELAERLELTQSALYKFGPFPLILSKNEAILSEVSSAIYEKV